MSDYEVMKFSISIVVFGYLNLLGMMTVSLIIFDDFDGLNDYFGNGITTRWDRMAWIMFVGGCTHYVLWRWGFAFLFGVILTVILLSALIYWIVQVIEHYWPENTQEGDLCQIQKI